jgi:hypothetical protein
MILVLLMCQAIAAVFIVIFTTLTAILISALWEQKRALEMDQEYDELADSREAFWDALHLAYGRFQESSPQAPEQLEDLITTDGFPPDFEPRKVKNLVQWLSENTDKLDQHMLWKFAYSMYPGRQDRQTVPVGHGLMESAHAMSFHEARGKLARFWNRWVPLNEWMHFILYFGPMRYLCRHYASARNQLIMLAWLELALVRRLEDHGRKEIALFKIAAKLARKPDQP